MSIDLFYFRGCPHVAAARETLRACLESSGLREAIREHEGAYPSPTVEVDGVDVMGAPAEGGAACRLDVPTPERLRVALSARANDSAGTGPAGS
ncbi:MAG: alkylmercury lyase [Candidatus Dormibacteria bacterium]